MNQTRTRELTVGSPMKLILRFMLPLIFGLLFQQFYSMVDTIVVGKFLGVDALAGVGSTGSINFLVLGLVNGICAGFAIPVAQKFGQRDFEGLRRFVGNMIWLGSAVALVVTVATTVLCRQILVWMHSPADIFQYAYDYIFLIFLGIPATMLYNLLSGILRSLGDSRTPLVFLILSSLLNVVLDVVLIVGFEMGVAGAGWATVISQLISGLLCLLYIIWKFPILHLCREDLIPRRSCMQRLMVMGFPMGMQYSITAIGSILLQTAVNGLSVSAVAAMTAGNKVSMLATCHLCRTESGRGKAGTGAPGGEGLCAAGHCLLGGHLWGAVPVWPAAGRAVPGHHGCDGYRPGAAPEPAVFDGKRPVLHTADVCEFAALYHSGTGLFQSGGVCRRV